MTPTLLTSKLTVPAPPAELVPRPRLHARLDAGVRAPLTLLGAPAGWGKTVLLSSWLRTGAAGWPVAWLSLEPGDGGERFWRYLHAALSSCGIPLAEVTEGEADPARFADTLARLPMPVVLVLDDLDQVGDGGVPDGLDFLLRHAAGRLRLVVAARADPPLALHRWRLRGELTELRADDLSFTVAETGELLTRHGLAAAHAGELHTRTEGWPAGARLAALSMLEAGDPAWFLPGFTGDDARVADYLRDEVLAGQPAQIRDVLLATSILGQVCAGLVEALTGRSDGERILAELDRSGAFVTRLAARPGWRRYHRLFAELLRAELRRQAPDQIPELHRRACGWLAAAGRPLDALRHALAAADFDRATGVLAEHWPDLIRHGHHEPPPAPAPAPPAGAVRADPELALAYAVDRLDRRDLTGAAGLLDLADEHRHRVPADRRARFAGILTALRLWQAELRGEPQGGRLLALRPPDGAAAIALTAVGTARLAEGALAAAQGALAEAQARADRAATPPPTPASHPDLSCPRLAGAGPLAFARALRGELRAAQHAARTALGGHTCAASAHCAYAYLALAVVDIEWDRLAEAEANLARIGDPGDPLLCAWVALVRARLLGERGEVAAGQEALRAARQPPGDWRPTRYLADCFAVAEAELRIRAGDTQTARRLLPALPATQAGPAEPAEPAGAVCLAHAHLRDGDPEAAIAALPDWAGPTAGALPLRVRLDAGLVEALAAGRLGEARRSRDAVEQVLRLAEPDGFRRPFTRDDPPVRQLLLDHLDSGTAYWSFLTELLSATTAQAPPARPERGTGELLTDRELAVLRYLPSMLSNVEIATSLCLSVNTVKTHVRHIYRKLDATRRREAVRRARELHLI